MHAEKLLYKVFNGLQERVLCVTSLLEMLNSNFCKLNLIKTLLLEEVAKLFLLPEGGVTVLFWQLIQEWWSLWC